VASFSGSRYLARMNAPAALPPKQRKPDWIRVKAPVSEG
jgi:lipoic acid synthetase